MGRDPLGRDERKVSGRNWSESPLKLEADLERLDNFLSKNGSKKLQKKQILTESEQITDLKKELKEISESKESKVEDSK